MSDVDQVVPVPKSKITVYYTDGTNEVFESADVMLSADSKTLTITQGKVNTVINMDSVKKYTVE